MVFATIVANIEVVKCIDLFGMSLTLGNVMYGTVSLITDVLNEKYGSKTARKSVYISFGTMLMFTLFMQINLMFIPNSEDFASGAMKTLFAITPRICVATLVAYLISNVLDTHIYDKLRKYKLWVRNNGSTMISQFVDTIIFTFIAFYGVFSMNMLIELIFTTYVIKIVIALIDTPVFYLLTTKLKKY